MAFSALLATALTPLLVSDHLRGREQSLSMRGFTEVAANMSYPHNALPCAGLGAAFA